MRRLLIFLGVLGGFVLNGFSQVEVQIDLSQRFQVINGFGASGAWNTDLVGEHWSESEKEAIAAYLFSKETDAQGNPEGIGLSRWRFNIGAGSYEQGGSSRISKPERRSECFMTSFNASTGEAAYDWTKHAGQQWFLERANTYGVEHLVAFCNSPPRFMTKNGYTNMDQDNRYASTNLKSEHYDDFATFMTEVLDHFENEGISFYEISPLNEPQWGWAGGGTEGQEGCPYKNEEVALLARALDVELEGAGLSTKILLGEAAQWNFLNETNVGNVDPDKQDQIRDFFDPSRTTTYVGDLDHVENGLCAHSYWINIKDNNAIRTYREAVRTLADQYGIDLYQSEYNLLGGGDHYDDYWLNALYLCKIIQADLVYANAKAWDFWTAIERERWDQKNRFFLLPLLNQGQGSGVHNYYDLDASGGYVGIDKNLWAYGNFTRFIRPDYQRVQVTNAENMDGLFGSAYVAPDTSKVVFVALNWGDTQVDFSTELLNPGTGWSVKEITPYLTDEYANDLTKGSVFTSGSYALQGKSIVTLVMDLEKEVVLASTPSEVQDGFLVVPNPFHDHLEVDFSGELQLLDAQGRQVFSQAVVPGKHVDVSGLFPGNYLVKQVETSGVKWGRFFKVN